MPYKLGTRNRGLFDTILDVAGDVGGSIFDAIVDEGQETAIDLATTAIFGGETAAGPTIYQGPQLGGPAPNPFLPASFVPTAPAIRPGPLVSAALPVQTQTIGGGPAIPAMAAVPAVAAAGSAVAAILGRISNFFGRRIRLASAVAFLKKFGLEAGAVALGITGFEAASLLVASSERASRRRRRGISGADIRRTKRTLKAVASIQDQLRGACASVGVRRRSSTRRRITHPTVIAQN